MKKVWIIVVTFFIFRISEATRTVTNEDIRDAILSVVHMIRSSEDKLERHEYRERNLGEQLKKSLLTLDKRLKLLDPVKGTISRLDERLATVETILMQKDERERIQLQKTFDTVEDIQKNLPLIMDKMKQDILEKLSKREEPKPQQTGPTSTDVKNLEKKLDDVSSTLQRLEKQLQSIQEDSKKIKDFNGNSSEALEKVKKQLNEGEQLLEKYEHKLDEMSNKIPLLSDAPAQKDWQTKFLQALDVQKSNVEKMLSDVKDVATKVQKLPEKRDLESVRNDTLDTLEKMKETSKPKDFSTDKLDEKIKDLKNDVNEKHKVISENLADIEKVVKGIEGTLGKSVSNLKEEIKTQAPDVHKTDIEAILKKIEVIGQELKELPDKADIEAVRKETFDKLDQINFYSYNPEMQPMVQDAGFETVDIKLKQLKQDSEERHQQLMDTIKEMGNSTDTLTQRFGASYLQLSDDIEKLSKLHEIVVKTDDSVRDTKRRVEYGVHQVIGEVKDLMKKYVKDINSTFNQRFDNFEVDMFGEENGALANFSMKIGGEIDKVWRQIGIMHQQMSASADTLNNLLNYTDQYANSSMAVMDGMKGKVGTIKEKMLEVDDNLNFLLGKLHLVTQEFNQVRNELAKVLDDIKKNFKKVQAKVEDIGPGPHKIDSSELDNPQE